MSNSNRNNYLKETGLKRRKAEFSSSPYQYLNFTDDDVKFQKNDIVNNAFRYFSMSAASYCPKEVLLSKSCIHCSKFFTADIIKIVEDPINNLSALILTESNSSEIVVSIRGSINWYQILGLLFSEPTKFIGDKDAKIRGNFYDYAQIITNLIMFEIKSILNSAYYSEYKIVLTGHSLGGALAMLCAIFLKEKINISYNKIIIYTFGQPRVGNEAFATWYNTHFINYYRIVNGRDIVPHILRQAKTYSHAIQEIFIDDYGNAIFCREDILEDPECSNSYWYYTIGPHSYMGNVDNNDPTC